MARPILIIEDDADISESLKYNFDREGLPAIIAPTGEAGLAAAFAVPDYRLQSYGFELLLLEGRSCGGLSQ